MPYHGKGHGNTAGHSQKGVYEKVRGMGGGKVKKSSNPSRRVSAPRGKKTQAY